MSLPSSPDHKSDGSHLDVDALYWGLLEKRDPDRVCDLTLFEPVAPGLLRFHFLNEEVRVNIKERCLLRSADGRWTRSEDSLLGLVTVIYLANVAEIYPIGQDIVGINDLKEWHFFTGPHELKLDKLIQRFGRNLDGFRRTAEALEGTPMDMADAAFRLLPFPRVPIYYLLWEGDDEFQPEVRLLFDRSIEDILQADAIWALANRVTQALVET